MKKPSKNKSGRPLIGSGRRILLTVSVDPVTASFIKGVGAKYGSRGLVVDKAIALLSRKEKK